MTQLEICNTALLDIGAHKTDAVGDGSVEGDLCEDYWDIIRREVLSSHTWNFAKKWAELTESAGYTFVDSEWSYAYDLPADLLKMSRMETKATKYVIREDNLLCNLDECKVEYIFDETTTANYPAHFITALVFRLGIAFYPKLISNKIDRAAELMKYYALLDRMKKQDAIQTKPHEINELQHTNATDSWLIARGVSSDNITSSV